MKNPATARDPQRDHDKDFSSFFPIVDRHNGGIFC